MFFKINIMWGNFLQNFVICLSIKFLTSSWAAEYFLFVKNITLSLRLKGLVPKFPTWHNMR